MNKARIIIIVLQLLYAVLMFNAQLIILKNNGDFYRLFQGTNIIRPEVIDDSHKVFEFKPLKDITPKSLIPLSSTAAGVALCSFVERVLGVDQFDFTLVTIGYWLIYVVGLVLLTLKLQSWLALMLTLLLINPYIVAFFNTLYEEGLFIALCPLVAYCLSKKHHQARLKKILIILMAATKLQFFPLFIFGFKKAASMLSNIRFIAVIIAVLVMGIFKNHTYEFDHVNAYNRYFSGLAYSFSHVSNWPVKDYQARRAYVDGYIDKDTIVFPAEAALIKPYWGSSFWPIADPADPMRQAAMAPKIKSWFQTTLVNNPKLWYLLISEPILTMIKADYGFAYLTQEMRQGGLLTVSKTVMRHFGWLFLIVSSLALLLAIKNRQFDNIMFILFCWGYPLFVVLGDGYYEFEKHVFPMVLLGFIFSITLVLGFCNARDSGKTKGYV